ncbi:MAG: RrF2 family transcriptional regulator [Christensenellales bacterium]|jgi:Rrf2 family iron-sulfur cluster assembly transcriptional regulator
MRISQEADYAFRSILYMSVHQSSKNHNVRTLSENLHIPLRFTSKIFQKLKQARLVVSSRGIYGGYSLSRDVKDITFLHVLEAIDGPLCINKCLRDVTHCSMKAADQCYIHRSLKKVQNELRNALSSINFHDALQPIDHAPAETAQAMQ